LTAPLFNGMVGGNPLGDEALLLVAQHELRRASLLTPALPSAPPSISRLRTAGDTMLRYFPT
jgi:hypothetical protein